MAAVETPQVISATPSDLMDTNMKNNDVCPGMTIHQKATIIQVQIIHYTIEQAAKDHYFIEEAQGSRKEQNFPEALIITL